MYNVRYLPLPAQKGVFFRITMHGFEKNCAVIMGIYIKRLSIFYFHNTRHDSVLDLSANAFVGFPSHRFTLSQFVLAKVGNSEKILRI